MTVHEYLQMVGVKPESCIRLAMMVGTVEVESEHCKHMVYCSTPAHLVWEWYNIGRTDTKERSKCLDYIVLNPEVHDMNWLSGANWNPAIDNHHMMMVLATPREELEKLYSPKQAQSTADYIEKKIIEDINSGKNPWLGKNW